jgi:hypothetical protein
MGMVFPVVEREFFKNNDLMVASSDRGGLEPHFRVQFSAIFQVLPWTSATRVENTGRQ